jgi:hypothetical protein
VIFTLLHPEIGVALIGWTPAPLEDLACVIRRVMAKEGLPGIPVVTLAVNVVDGTIGDRLFDAFAEAPPCSAPDREWPRSLLMMLLQEGPPRELTAEPPPGFRPLAIPRGHSQGPQLVTAEAVPSSLGLDFVARAAVPPPGSQQLVARQPIPPPSSPRIAARQAAPSRPRWRRAVAALSCAGALVGGSTLALTSAQPERGPSEHAAPAPPKIPIVPAASAAPVPAVSLSPAVFPSSAPSLANAPEAAAAPAPAASVPVPPAVEPREASGQSMPPVEPVTAQPPRQPPARTKHAVTKGAKVVAGMRPYHTPLRPAETSRAGNDRVDNNRAGNNRAAGRFYDADDARLGPLGVPLPGMSSVFNGG